MTSATYQERALARLIRVATNGVEMRRPDAAARLGEKSARPRAEKAVASCPECVQAGTGDSVAMTGSD
jgi:hypothetical protein